MAPKKEVQPEIDLEKQTAEENAKLMHHTRGIQEKLARRIGCTTEEIRAKQIIIKGDSIVVK